MERFLPVEVKNTLKMLEEAGYAAYVVGGCVRDSLLGKTPYDWDITSSATPEELMQIFPRQQLVPTGIEHGTMTLVGGDFPLEITTMRSDGMYRDHRRPESVAFSRDIHEDLKRRDFTVNAMAYSPQRGFCDDFGGLDDLRAKTIRCVGQADRRFEEDALRILRALRFSSTLRFHIQAQTACAIMEKKELLLQIASERICQEMIKLFAGADAGKILAEFSEVFQVFLPEASYERAPLVGRCSGDTALCLAVLLYGNALSQAETVLARLRFCGEIQKATLAILRELALPPALQPPQAARMLSRIGEADARRVLSARALLSLADGERQRTALEEALGGCYRLCDLQIDGKALQDIGFQGKEIGHALRSLLEAVMDGQSANTRPALWDLAKKMREEYDEHSDFRETEMF